MRLRGITRNVVVLGIVSFFTDVASEMLYPVMPLFLVGVLGQSPALLGVVDGLAEGISSGLRWLGGALSDRYRRRKPFVFAGYATSALSKPIMGLAAVAIGWPLFLIGRCADRLGKSIRTSARDALIADSTAPEYRGIAFGLHRAMDTMGAVLGPLLTLAIIMAIVGPSTTFNAKWATDKSEVVHSANIIQNLPLTQLFYFALIPGLLSALMVLMAVREVPPKSAGEAAGPPSIFQSYPPAFWHLLIANAIFSLGNSSDSFLLLRSGEVGLTFGGIVLAFAVYNVVYALAALPLGHLSDKIGRKPVIIAGWLTYAAVYAGFAVTKSPVAPWVLLGVYGLYQAFTEGVSKAFVSDVVPSHQRAGAIGLYYTASGLGQLIASLLAGVLWHFRIFNDQVMTAFAIGALFALVAIPLIATIRLHNSDQVAT
ncbi:MAG TPA: MFS transporter [Tepidisphaeraceae bacterium]|jgi:MFS family permease